MLYALQTRNVVLIYNIQMVLDPSTPLHKFFIEIFDPNLIPVFVKQVVRRFHAASLISLALLSRSGFSQTGPAGCQLRGGPDQRSGFCARAFA